MYERVKFSNFFYIEENLVYDLLIYILIRYQTLFPSLRPRYCHLYIFIIYIYIYIYKILYRGFKLATHK